MRRCSATPSSTARCPAARPSCCECRTPTTGRSRCPTVRPTTDSCSCPTCCPPPGKRVEYAGVPNGGSLVVLGLGPIGDMACRIALHRGVETVIGIDLVPERLERSRARGVEVLDLNDLDKQSDLVDAVRALHERAWSRRGDRRGRHGSARFAGCQSGAIDDRHRAECARREADEEGRRRSARRTPLGDRTGSARRNDLGARRLRRHDRPDADDDAVRQADPDSDGSGQRAPLGRRHPAAARSTTTRSASTSFATHHLPLDDAPDAYEMFQKKSDGADQGRLQPLTQAPARTADRIGDRADSRSDREAWRVVAAILPRTRRQGVQQGRGPSTIAHAGSAVNVPHQLSIASGLGRGHGTRCDAITRRGESGRIGPRCGCGF